MTWVVIKITTFYNGKPDAIETWGPYDSPEEVEAARRRMHFYSAGAERKTYVSRVLGVAP